MEWLDANLRGQLEHKRDELKGQLNDLEHLLNGHKAAAPRIVRAGRRPMSMEARKKISQRMKATWRKRKAGAE